jgi:hypothetical protein
MDTLQINHALMEWKPVFKGTFAINQIPTVYTLDPPFALVLNMDAYPSKGSHWVAMYCNNKESVEYFDSGGMPPPNHDNLDLILNRYNNNVVYNPKRLQSSCTSVCGEYCILYLICRLHNISFTHFVDFFSERNWLKNDATVFRIVHENCNILPRLRAFPIVSSSCLQIAEKLII